MQEFRGYPVLERSFSFGGRDYEILGPANFDELIDDPKVAERFYRDGEFMPYWAEFWPASLVLAERVAAWPEPERPTTVLEIGCGLGLISVIAATRGYDVIASDYDDDALAFVAENIQRNQVESVRPMYIDWRASYPELRPDWIIAAEVTYERQILAPLASFVSKHLPPTGRGLFVDRNRQVADTFPDVAAEHGLSIEIEPTQWLEPDGSVQAARLFHIQPRGAE
ncbi:MAG: protein N-lysine methyltransferase family protein [Firmicutes bacterium]|nr:protein N-lysine methyltransferase family protein [Bacillota bacterium]